MGHVWLHRGEGIGAVSDEALAVCAENDLTVVAGYCPFMFLSNTSFFHKIHGFVMKIGGKYPS